jgi:hypothetical protein
VSSTGTYAPKPVSADAGTRATTGSTINVPVAAVIIVLFVLSAILSAARKDITQGFDELAHTSYVAHIQSTGQRWPALDRMRLLDPRSFQFSDEANYLNHPPMFYALLAALGPTLEHHPQALFAHRLIDVAIAALGLAALLALGLAAQFPRAEFYAFAVPIACIPALVPIAGSVNNDNLAFLGGAVAVLGAWQLAATGRSGWLALALTGVVAASFAKLTGLILTGALVSAVVFYLMWRGRVPWSWTIALGLALVLAALPYVVYMVQYGSPTPQTPAQIALVTEGSRDAGWSALPRKSFPAYFGYFVVAFVNDWMPTLAERNAFNYAMLAIPVATLACAAVGLACSARRLWRHSERPLDIIVVCGAGALAVTFLIHIVYSYGRHVATGWLMDAYPRYYLPLAAVVPLACLSLLGTVEAPRRRAALLIFLITGPVVFRIFGAPFG